MWWFYTFVLILTVIQKEAATKDDDIGIMDGKFKILKIVADIQDTIKLKCEKNDKKHVYDELELMFMRLPQCWNHTSSAIPENIFQLICTEGRNAYYDCIEGVTTKLSECLEPEEHYLPEFILQSFNATYDQRCKNGVRLEKDPDLHCNVGKWSILDYFNDCLRLNHMRFLKGLGNEEFILTPHDLCHDLIVAKGCTLNFFKEHCPTSHTSHNYIRMVFDTHTNICINFTTSGTNFIHVSNTFNFLYVILLVFSIAVFLSNL